jgi:predicted Rossmann fold nucleotide-binding protein DprA/Smf involved in DNA uptake
VLPETRRSEGVSSATATPDATPGNTGRTNGAEVSIADILLFADGPVGVREIARQSGQNPGTVSKRLNRMERDGQAVRTDTGWVLPTAVREGDQ